MLRGAYGSSSSSDTYGDDMAAQMSSSEVCPSVLTDGGEEEE